MNEEGQRFIEDPPAPRLAKNAEAPGEYRLAIRVIEAEVDPGGELYLELFITGYGNILGSKMTFFPPASVIDKDHSTAFHDMQYVPAGDGHELSFGAKESKFSEVTHETGILMTWTGLKHSSWEQPTFFIDTHFQSPTASEESVAIVMTERKLTKAPVELTLKVKEKAPSGQHELRFYFTYFNGEQWKVDSQVVSVLVRSWLRRNDVATVVITLVVAAVALFAAVGSFVLDLLQYIKR